MTANDVGIWLFAGSGDRSITLSLRVTILNLVYYIQYSTLFLTFVLLIMLVNNIHSCSKLL